MEFVSYDIASSDFRRAGAASRSIKERLKRIGADAEAIRRTMIAAYEAEMNVVIHSVGGRLEASLSESRIDIDVIDGGPGIPDIEQAMVEGFSTASAEARALGFGAGMGLPNIKRNSDRLRISSRPGDGTRVSFSVYLQPERTTGTRLISLYASADRCRDCRACLTACPTQAMRVRDGCPSVLEHLCVDCTYCIAACTSQALGMREEITSLDDLSDREGMVLVVPPALLAGCGPDYPPAQVLTALQGLGFAEVITAAPFEEALRRVATDGRGAVGAPAAGAEGRAAPDAGSLTPGPVILPACPAVVNLIELRFPSLVPHLAAYDSPWEAIQATYGDRSVAYVVSCPSQRTALLQVQTPDGDCAELQTEYLAPEVVRQAVMMKVTGAGSSPTPVLDPQADGPSADHDLARPETEHASAGEALVVTGMKHVSVVLEKIEDGLLDDVPVVEPFACEGGCFGSPLLSEDYHVATRRWKQGREAVEAVVGASAGGARQDAPLAGARAIPRRRAFVARPGIRLDADMARAILKLGELQRVVHSLPGRDCGTCGAPSCAALAEDIVMQRADAGLCPYTDVQKEGRG